MNDWLVTLQRRLATQPALVRVTVATVLGSAPREPGASMLISHAGEDGTVGGGHLEWQAIQTARQMLDGDAGAVPRLIHFTLGPQLGQCCGGMVELWFERFTAADLDFVERVARLRRHDEPLVMATLLEPGGGAKRAVYTDAGAALGEFSNKLDRTMAAVQAIGLHAADAPRASVVRTAQAAKIIFVERIDHPQIPLWLFGAGHVGKALVNVLSGLPFRVSWIDSRDAIFPSAPPAGVEILVRDAPADTVRDAPPRSCFLVMTHRHDLDYEICRAVLQRGDFRWAGLIGSRSKAARFAHRLARHGVAAQRIARLTCPIGIDGVTSKTPAAIAVSVAAQLLQIAPLRVAHNRAAPAAVADGCNGCAGH
jgi:xanthine dehydrogenase accessory factor